MREKKYYLIYQIKNLIDGRIYVGAHCTNKVNDSYMGSSKHLKKDMKNLGKQNFEKTILYIFDNKEEMMSKEAEIVNREFVHDPNTYNLIVGGLDCFSTIGRVSVKDQEGNTLSVYNDDPRYLSGELVGATMGKKLIENSIRNKGMVTVKDENGNMFKISNTDPRFLSGELVHNRKGLPGNSAFKDKIHKEETKEKMSEKAKLRTGDKNSSFGTCWIMKESENKKIKQEELDAYLHQGWINGRKI